MTKKTFFTPDEQTDDDRYIGVIYESNLQSFARDNFGRELTDIELNRVAQAMWDDEDTADSLMDVYHSAIAYALDEEADWKDTDDDYLNQ